MPCHRFVLTLLATILGLCVLGAPLPAGAATGRVVASPTHLRPVQGKTDCAAALSLAAFVCDAAVGTGVLQLIWDESVKTVTGYKVYRVDGGSHNLLGAATGTARYYLVNKPSGGYANQCFAVQASVGSQTSADSSHYCYAPGGAATTLSLKPSHTVTNVAVTTSAHLTCSDVAAPAFPAYFKAANSHFGSAFTAFFPWLLHERATQVGGSSVSGVYAGNETGVWPLCKGTGNGAFAQFNALGVAVFDLDLKALAKHKLYSATLTLTPSQTVALASGKATLSSGRWCQAYVGGNGSLTRPFVPSAFAQSTVVPREASINVTPIVAAWVQYGINYGFIVGTPSQVGALWVSDREHRLPHEVLDPVAASRVLLSADPPVS